MSWLTILGFVAIFVGPWLIADLIARLRRSCPSAARRGVRVFQRRRTPLLQDPMFWIAHGGAVKRWE